MPITLDANGKYIHVTGGTGVAPVTWADIVAADTSGGWGRITTLNAVAPAQYLVAADTLIYIGDNGATSTYVAVEICQITFVNGYFQIRSGADVTKATLRVGRQSSTNYAVSLTMRGLPGSAEINLAQYGTLQIYNSQIFIANQTVMNSLVADVRNSFVTGHNLMGGGNVTLIDSVFQSIQLYSSPATATFTATRSTLLTFNAWGVGLAVIRDMEIGWFQSRNAAVTPVAMLYDTTYDSVNNTYTIPPQSPVNYEHSTLNLTVQDVAGAALAGAEVVVRDVGGATVYSGVTDAAGAIPRQDVLFRTRTLTGGGATTDVAHTPHTVTITKTGYLTQVLTLDMSTRHDAVAALETLSASLADFPAVSDVRAATVFDDGSKVGTLALPATGDVRAAIAYDDGSKVGTLALPATGDVRLATAYDDGSKLGTLALPTPPNVLNGVGYGAAGSEFTGTLEPSVTVGEGITATITEDVLTVAIND